MRVIHSLFVPRLVRKSLLPHRPYHTRLDVIRQCGRLRPTCQTTGRGGQSLIVGRVSPSHSSDQAANPPGKGLSRLWTPINDLRFNYTSGDKKILWNEDGDDEDGRYGTTHLLIVTRNCHLHCWHTGSLITTTTHWLRIN